MKLLSQLAERLRVLHYAFGTEQAYVAWAERYLRFHHDRDVKWLHPGSTNSEATVAIGGARLRSTAAVG